MWVSLGGSVGLDEGMSVCSVRVDHVDVGVALVWLWWSGAGVPRLFLGVLDLLSLAFMFHRL